MRKHKQQFINRLRAAIRSETPTLYMHITGKMMKQWKADDRMFREPATKDRSDEKKS